MKYLLSFVLALLLLCTLSQAQEVSLLGRIGLSDFSNGGGAGFHIGAGADFALRHDMLIGSEFNLNTQNGTPIEWGNYFKYLIDLPSGKVKPYVDGGFNLWFYTGGPYFGLRFGGGVLIPVAKNIYVPADVQLGPAFTPGSTTFCVAFTSGIRYSLP
jgi:hypothetical protein